MILLKIGVTLIAVALMMLIWFTVGYLIGDTIRDFKYNMGFIDSILWDIFYTLIASGVTLIMVYGVHLLYIGGI